MTQGLPQPQVLEQLFVIQQAREGGVHLRHRDVLEADDQRIDEREQPDEQQDQDCRRNHQIFEIPVREHREALRQRGVLNHEHVRQKSGGPP